MQACVRCEAFPPGCGAVVGDTSKPRPNSRAVPSEVSCSAEHGTCVWSWVFRTRGIACVKVQWFCFGNVFGNHYDPKVQFTFSNLFGNTFEDLDDFKMYLHFVLVLGNPFLDPKL